MQDESGKVIRPWGPAEADDTLRLPPGGWYRLIRRDPVGEAEAIGGRFAAGLVILVTGQSQASAFFADGPAEAGAFPAQAEDPVAPPIAALLHACAPRPGCAADGTTWTEVGNRLGARVLLAELERLLGRPLPLALANLAWGGASAAELADPAAPAGANLRRLAGAAAPVSAALILGHGTTDALLGTPPEAYAAGLRTVVGALRAAGGPAMPVLQAPLAPIAGETRLIGSGRLAGLLLPWDSIVPTATPGAAPGGLAHRQPLSMAMEAQVTGLRRLQEQLRVSLDLRRGGNLAAVTPGLDGIHWTARGVRLAAREVAAALAAALPGPFGAPP